MKPTPRILKAVDPYDLIAQVQASLEMGEDLIVSPFVSEENLICQRVTQSLVIYEYMLIVASDLDSLQKQEQVLDDLGYDYIFNTILWNGRYLQWMQRLNTAGVTVRDAMVKLAQVIPTPEMVVDELEKVS